jgi:hypothetical protein
MPLSVKPTTDYNPEPNASSPHTKKKNNKNNKKINKK